MHDHLLTRLKTRTPELVWPKVPDPVAAAILGMLYQLEKAERLPPEVLADLQMLQAAALLRHAAATVPYYRHRIPPACLDGILTPDSWRRIPISRRTDIQDAGRRLVSSAPPPGHEKLVKVQTSGSTGMPVVAFTTQLTRFMFHTLSLHQQAMRGWDLSGKFMHIQPIGNLEPGRIIREDSWKQPFPMVAATGPSVALSARTDVAAQLEHLRREAPDYLITLPSNLLALVELSRAKQLDVPSLKEVVSYGEVLTPETVAACESVWGIPVADNYSSQEVGYMAIQCREGHRLHVQSASVLVEVLDDGGRPCRTGETGEVVVTSLLNYGGPLIRYALGDYAEVGEPCPCGRTLPVLARINGRQRNMLRRPDGGRMWPTFSVRNWPEDIPIKQFQFVQTSLTRIEVNLVAERPLRQEEEALIADSLHKRLNYPFDIGFNYLTEIPRSRSGKFEDFRSEIET